MDLFNQPHSSALWERAISPMRELAAYEALWRQKGTTFKTIADQLREHDDLMPSALVGESEIAEAQQFLSDYFGQKKVSHIGVQVRGTAEYPKKLLDAKHPVVLLYYQGLWDLVYSPSVAIVGSRKASQDGIRRARKLARALVADGFTIVSGLADGIDTAAHQAAIDNGGKTIAVIGTPLSHVYPKKNEALQSLIRKQHLLISQVPFGRYTSQDYRSNRSFFPERNVTMSALTKATIIVEASDTSGTLYQAKAAISQGRQLFILESCFQNKSITWPEKYEKWGAIRVKEYEDIRKHLANV